MLRFFLTAPLVHREIDRLQFNASLSNRDQCRIGQFLGAQGAKTIDSPDQRFDFNSALSCKSAERREAALATFGTLNQTMPREIVERIFQPLPIPATAAGLCLLEYAKACFE